MSVGKMHEDEGDIDVSLVGRLLAAQFPTWADLRIEPVRSSGTVNALYRLGNDMVVRLPRIPGATGDVEKEHRWLPTLARSSPLPSPSPSRGGTPGEGYPWHWSVYRWLEGETATIERIVDVRGGDRPDAIRRCPSADRSNGRSSARGVQLMARGALSKSGTRRPATRSPLCGACSIPNS